jgi:cytidine deaminase
MTPIEQAIQARTKAYAPYSQFKVGACVISTQGVMAQGANVENCSYGLTLCAERNAITQAVLLGMQPGELDSITIALDAPEAASPCGACRQTIAEFAHPNTQVHLYNLRTQQTNTYTAQELLPHAFSPKSLTPPAAS